MKTSKFKRTSRVPFFTLFPILLLTWLLAKMFLFYCRPCYCCCYWCCFFNFGIYLLFSLYIYWSIGMKMLLSEKTSVQLFIALYKKECYYFALDHRHRHDKVKELEFWGYVKDFFVVRVKKRTDDSIVHFFTSLLRNFPLKKYVSSNSGFLRV